jgi:hypothetical protein
MPEPPDQTRAQLAATIRELSVNLHWQDGKGDDKQALNYASQLLIAVTMYEQLLVQEVGFLPFRGGDSNRPRSIA